MLGVLGVHGYSYIFNRYPDTGQIGNAKAISSIIEEIDSNPPSHVIFVFGGSYAARGIDWKSLESRLGETGLQVRIIPFMAPGANHFERLSLVHSVRRISGKKWKSLERVGHLWILEEISMGYDLNPVEQIEANLFSDRALGYLTPEIAYSAACSLLSISRNRKAYSYGMSPEKLAEIVVKHGLINCFNVGILWRKSCIDKIRATDLYWLLSGSSVGFEFKPLDTMMKTAVTYDRGVTADIFWKREYFYPSLMMCFPSHSRIGYITMPNSSGSGFVQESEYSGEVLLTMRDNVCLLNRLNDRSMWWDSNHLNANGAKCFTDWLFEELVSDVTFLEK
ncbi:MAG: hypothetical protein GX577_14575 [Leptolinea sp.]|nr:hypothetical protein [Leptolinea sp.]